MVFKETADGLRKIVSLYQGNELIKTGVNTLGLYAATHLGGDALGHVHIRGGEQVLEHSLHMAAPLIAGKYLFEKLDDPRVGSASRTLRDILKVGVVGGATYLCTGELMDVSRNVAPLSWMKDSLLYAHHIAKEVIPSLSRNPEVLGGEIGLIGGAIERVKHYF